MCETVESIVIQGKNSDDKFISFIYLSGFVVIVVIVIYCYRFVSSISTFLPFTAKLDIFRADSMRSVLKFADFCLSSFLFVTFQ